MENEPNTAGGQQERFTTVEAGQALDNWVKKNRPRVKTRVDLVKLLISEGVLSKKSVEKGLQMNLSNLLKGNWGERKRCPRETALRVFRWMGMEESKIPQEYLDPPNVNHWARPSAGIGDTVASVHALFGRIYDSDVSARELIALHVVETGNAHKTAMIAARELYLEAGDEQGHDASETIAALELYIQYVTMMQKTLVNLIKKRP